MIGRPLVPPFTNDGICPGCNQATTFEVRDAWLRDHYVCRRCGSIPRERALMVVLEMLVPDWRDKVVHESSPSGRGPSVRFARECARYLPTQYWGPSDLGKVINGVRNESLERLTCADDSIDVHVTQDVFEHLFDFELASQEIARTLRPGGLHIFTAPIVRKHEPTVRRARQRPDGTVEHLLPPAYHGNPIDPGGSLVVWDFGFDLADRIHAAAGTPTTCYVIDDLERGIRAEYIEVFASRKRRFES